MLTRISPCSLTLYESNRPAIGPRRVGLPLRSDAWPCKPSSAQADGKPASTASKSGGASGCAGHCPDCHPCDAWPCKGSSVQAAGRPAAAATKSHSKVSSVHAAGGPASAATDSSGAGGCSGHCPDCPPCDAWPCVVKSPMAPSAESADGVSDPRWIRRFFYTSLHQFCASCARPTTNRAAKPTARQAANPAASTCCNGLGLGH